MNPPYGSDTPLWMQRLMNHGNGIALVFARPDTAWFHDYIPKADAICFIKGRVHFVPAKKARIYAKGLYTPKSGCGAASMLVAYGRNNAEMLLNSGLGFGLALPVSKPLSPHRAGESFRGETPGQRRPAPMRTPRPARKAGRASHI